MPFIRVDVKPAALGQLQKRMFPKMKKDQLRMFHQLGKHGVGRLRVMSEDIKDLKNYQNGWFYTAPINRVEWSNRTEHAIYVEMGRRPGAKPPPVDALRGWCERKLGDANLAYPVAKKIGKKGIKARPIMGSKSFQRDMRVAMRKGMNSLWWGGVKDTVASIKGRLFGR